MPWASGSIWSCAWRGQWRFSSYFKFIFNIYLSVPRASGSICGCAQRGHWGDSRIFICFCYIRISSLSFWFHTWLCTKRSEVTAESCLWSACARVNAAGVPRLPRLKVELNRREAGAVSKDYVSLVHRHEQPRSCQMLHCLWKWSRPLCLLLPPEYYPTETFECS